MCGIAGFVGKGDRQVLENMIGVISYRGPDDRGVFLRGNIGFAHARLSIIDLSPAGHQPMASVDGDTVIIFNGEIYNFKELRDELVKTGKYTFKSKSDTEVIICLYQEYGEKAIAKLDGMFAFALYDFKNSKLVLARDRMGKKPLYWCLMDGTLIFGSELKALMRHPSFRKELDLQSLSRYLLYEYVPTPYSIFKNVYKLEAGNYLVFDNKAVVKRKYWLPKPEIFSGDINEAEKHLDELLYDAVKKRLLAADVPVGVFLSGGIDSSTVAYYSQKNNSQKLKTFSIGFEEESFDESKYAEKVAQFLGTDHHSQTISGKDTLELIPQIAELMDEPLADASILPTYLLSKYTRQYVTVALGGDGGDELLAGYPTFQAEKLAAIYGAMPKPIRDYFIKPLLSLLPASENNFSWGFKLRQFSENFHDDKNRRHQIWRGSFSPENQSDLLSREILNHINGFDTLGDVDLIAEDLTGLDSDQKLLQVYQKTYLLDDILVKADRASMYNSLEVRAPFMDTAVVEFVNNLPYNFKYRGLTGKYILKQFMVDKLPPGIAKRAKRGFGIPLARWLKNELRGLCRELLSEERIKREGLFNAKYVSGLMDDHFSGKKDNRKLLWTLMVFQMWQDNFNNNK